MVTSVVRGTCCLRSGTGRVFYHMGYSFFSRSIPFRKTDCTSGCDGAASYCCVGCRRFVDLELARIVGGVPARMAVHTLPHTIPPEPKANCPTGIAFAVRGEPK